MQIETYNALVKLFDKKHPEWTEDLLVGDGLRWIYSKVLTPVEREITSMKITGYVDGEIAIHLGIKITTVKCHISDIKYKYRNGIGRRIDNHPAIRKAQGFIVRSRRRSK